MLPLTVLGRIVIGGVAAFGLAALGLCGCGEPSTHAHRPRTVALAEAPETPRVTPPPRPPPPPAPGPGLISLRIALAKQMRLAGPQSGAAVYDLTKQMELYSLRARVARPPASVEKLYTTVAALLELGPGARLHTTVLGAGHLGPGGVWHGDLYLHGGGDPTFGDGGFNRTWNHGYGPTAAQLVEQLQRRGIRHVTGQVIGDASLFDDRPGGPATGYAPDTPDYEGELGALVYDHGSTNGKLSPGAFSARQFAETMSGAGIQVQAASSAGRTPAHAQVLASVSSPPLSVLLQLMDVPSDDLFADMLAEQLGARYGTAGSISAGAHVISQEIASYYGLRPSIADGSGLSRSDLSSPSELVNLLRAVWHTPVGDVLYDSLPVVGKTGTVATIAVKTPAQGRCVAKTGTLNNVTNLAGYCHATGGHTLVFALLIDGPSNSQALTELGPMVATIAHY